MRERNECDNAMNIFEILHEKSRIFELCDALKGEMSEKWRIT